MTKEINIIESDYVVAKRRIEIVKKYFKDVPKCHVKLEHAYGITHLYIKGVTDSKWFTNYWEPVIINRDNIVCKSNKYLQICIDLAKELNINTIYKEF